MISLSALCLSLLSLFSSLLYDYYFLRISVSLAVLENEKNILILLCFTQLVMSLASVPCYSRYAGAVCCVFLTDQMSSAAADTKSGGGKEVDYTGTNLANAAAASLAAVNSKSASGGASGSGSGSGSGDAGVPATATSGTGTGSADSKQKLIASTDHIYLIGDSVLDNFIWLAHPKEKNLHSQLRSVATDPKTIWNFAVDESTTADVLIGKIPGPNYVHGRKQFGLEQYPTDPSDGKTYPLELVSAAVAKLDQKGGAGGKKAERGIAVVSAGGNDARVNLQYFMSGGAEAVRDAMDRATPRTHKGFTENTKIIVTELLKRTPYVVLVVCYLPHKSFFGGMMNTAGADKFRSQLLKFANHIRDTVILPLARTHKLPVIDLSRTFNSDDGTHYGRGGGASPIEPSDLSTRFIVDLIVKITHEFKFGSDESKVYFGTDPNAITVVSNGPETVTAAGSSGGGGGAPVSATPCAAL